MCKVIAIGNSKGGVGKTSTASNLAIGLARNGKRVLAIDNDPQGHLSMELGIENPGELEVTLSTIMEKLINDEEIMEGEGIIHVDVRLDLVPTNLKHSGMELELFSALNRERVLMDYITMNRLMYDYIIIDCQPTLGLLTINALTAADSVIIPVQAEKMAVDGLQQMIQVVGMVRRKLNRNLEIEGVLFTIVEERTRNAKKIMNLVREAYENELHIYKMIIPKSVKVKECSGTGYSIFDYDPNGRVALAYDSFTKEVISNE